MDKLRLKHAILENLQRDLEVLTRAALMAKEEATSEESKAENKYDTRGQEAAYLAEGQAKLATELQESIALFQALPLSASPASTTIGLGSVVSLKGPGSQQWYFLVARNGGLEITLDEKTITLVTPQSPLGRQLFGKRLGDTIQLQSRKGLTPHKISSVD